MVPFSGEAALGPRRSEQPLLTSLPRLSTPPGGRSSRPVSSAPEPRLVRVTSRPPSQAPASARPSQAAPRWQTALDARASVPPEPVTQPPPVRTSLVPQPRVPSSPENRPSRTPEPRPSLPFALPPLAKTAEPTPERLATPQELLEAGQLVAWATSDIPSSTVQIARAELDRLWSVEQKHTETLVQMRLLFGARTVAEQERALTALQRLLQL